MARELEQLLQRTKTIAEGTARKLQFYRLSAELEQVKEPSANEWYEMPWKSDSLTFVFADNPDFLQAFMENREQRFPKDVCVALYVADEKDAQPLFQCVHSYDDVKELDVEEEGASLGSSLSEFNVNLSAAGELELLEDQIRAFEVYLRSTPTLDGLADLVSQQLGEETKLQRRLAVSLSSKNPALSQLISELKRIEQESCLPSVLSDFLENRVIDNFVAKVEPDELVTVAPMDDAQRNAVAQSLSSKVSVVTGPPGCGKTQVILNLLANAVLQGKSVLVSSKNNKAVDNVRDRLIRMEGLETSVVRFGSKMVKDTQTMPGLDEMLSVAQRLGPDREKAIANLAAAESRHKEACARQKDAKALIAERDRLSVMLPQLVEAKELAIRNLADVETRTQQETDGFLASNVEKRVFEGRTETELEGFITPFRIKRNTFSGKYSGLGRIWVNLFTKRRHAAELVNAVMSFPVGIRQRVEAITGRHSPEEFRSGDAVLDLYRRVDDVLEEGLAYLDAKVKLRQRVENEISAARARAEESEERVVECRDALDKVQAKGPDEMLAKAVADIQANSLAYVAATFAKKLSTQSAPQSISTFTGYVKNGVPWRYQELEKFESDVRSFLNVCPLVALTSLSAKGSLPLAKDLFDLLVIDEASQCDVASVLPLLYRAKQVVVIGDPRQLKHISANKKADEVAIKEHLRLVNVPYLCYAESSLWDCSRNWLTHARGNAAPLMLNGHYRCHPKIIEYSNMQFYKTMGGLDVRTRPFEHPLKDQGCFWVDAQGRQASPRYNVNYEEVRIAIAKAEEIARLNPEVSIGLVTPFKAQAEKLHSEIQKLPSDIKGRITASTVHKFQGDERDVMIYSLVVTSNSPATKINWIDEGAPNLVNVAVTRARQALYIVGNSGYVRGHSSPAKPLGALLNYVENL